MKLIKQTRVVLKNAQFYLKKITLVEYKQPIELLSNSTIGQHTRHFIEFYQCLLNQTTNRDINYCLRKRDIRIEENTNIAIDAIDTILEKITALDLQKEVFTHTAKVDGTSLKSTVGRELYYNIEHTIHHLALIKVALKITNPDLVLPENFGVAPSTAQHLKCIAQS